MFWRKTKEDKGTKSYAGVGNTVVDYMRKQHLSSVNELASNHVIISPEIKDVLILTEEKP